MSQGHSARVRLGMVAVLVAMVTGLLPVGGAPAVASIGATSGLSWRSDLGDPIGGGTDGHLDAGGATFSMISSGAGSARVQITLPNAKTWDFEFQTGPDTLGVGSYIAGAPGYNSYLIGKGPDMVSTCVIYGSFTVLDVTHDPVTEEVASLAVDLSGTCSAGYGTFAANLRYQTTRGYSLVGSPTSGAFGDVTHTLTATKDVSITSVGSGDLVVSNVELAGAEPSAFSITAETCTAAPVAPGATCRVTVSRTASDWNWTSAILRFTTDAVRPTLDVPLSASTGSALSAPATFDFGTVSAGVVVEAPLTLSNVGLEPATVGTLTISGYWKDRFGLGSDGCTGQVLAAGATCQVIVSAYTIATYELTATLIIPEAGSGLRYPPGIVVGLAVTGAWDPATITKSGIHLAAPAKTWTGGGALGRTVTSTGARLHAVSSSSRVGTRKVKDGGPYEPVIYTRGNGTGTTWSSGKRLNPSTQHGIWPVLAATGSHVHVAWVSAKKVVAFSRSAARSIWYRTNAARGSGTWATTKRLTSATGRVDNPSIAAAGANVYIAYTNANSGAVKLLVSHNSGRSFTTVRIGTTTLTSGYGGRTGLVSVAASGTNVLVAWAADGHGTLRTRISTTSGRSFAAAETIGATSASPSAAAAAGRLGVGWIAVDPVVKVWTASGGWAPARAVPDVDHEWLTVIYAPALVLADNQAVGIVFTGCIQLCDEYRSGTVVGSYYAESPTNGITWYQGYASLVGLRDGVRPIIEFASVVPVTATRRDLLFTGWNPASGWLRVCHQSISVVPTADAQAQLVPAAQPGVVTEVSPQATIR